MSVRQESTIQQAPGPSDRMENPDAASDEKSVGSTLDLICRAGAGLQGKRVGMVVFSQYPDDPRPRRIISALLKENMKIDLICLQAKGSPRRETLPGLKISRLRLRNSRGGALSYIWQYGTFILAASALFAFRSMRRRYDLVYVHNMPDVLVTSALIPKLLGARVILDMHDPMPELMSTIFKCPAESGKVQLMKTFEKWSMARADLVLTVNASFKSIFCSRSCPVHKIGVVMNSPDEQIFSLKRPRSATGKDTPNRPLVLMYHGSLLERNGIDLAVDALAVARQTVSDVELRIYGATTPFFEQVMAAAQRRGLDKMIRYFGHKSLEEIASAITECDVGVVPNHRNTFTAINTPTRIFEYLTMGKPVIAPSTPGILDYFTEDSLLFFEPGNAADIARQIEYAARNYPGALRIAERGQQICLQHTWKQERSTLVQLVSGLLSSGKAA